MLSEASVRHLMELNNEDSLDSLQVLDVFMAEELIPLKEVPVFEKTTYVIGTPTRNRLLQKKQQSNSSFNDNVVFVVAGEAAVLFEAAQTSSHIRDEDNNSDGISVQASNDFEMELNLEPGDCCDDDETVSITDEIHQIIPEPEPIDGDDKGHDIMVVHPAFRGGAVAIPIEYIPRRHLNVLVEGPDFSPMGITGNDLLLKVSAYFEKHK